MSHCTLHFHCISKNAIESAKARFHCMNCTPPYRGVQRAMEVLQGFSSKINEDYFQGILEMIKTRFTCANCGVNKPIEALARVKCGGRIKTCYSCGEKATANKKKSDEVRCKAKRNTENYKTDKFIK